MIKALLLDVDGVLITGTSFRELLARDHGISHEMTTPFFRDRFPACQAGSADLRDELNKFIQDWGWQQSVDDFLRYWFTCEQTLNNQLIMAVQLMRQQGVKSYLATNQERYRAVYLWNKLGFNKKFDGMFASSQIGHLKPAPAFYQHVLQSLNPVQPQEVLYWDDNEQNVEAARQIGLLAEAYTSYSDFVQKTTKHIMPTPSSVHSQK